MPNNRDRRIARRTARESAIVPTDTTTTTTTTATVEPVPPTDVPAVADEPTYPAFTNDIGVFDVVASVHAMYAAANVAPPATVSDAFVAMVGIIRAIVPTLPTDVAVRARGYNRIVRQFADAMTAAGWPVINADDATAPRNTTRFAGMGITDAQNVLYVAIAASRVHVPADVICCVWRAIAPRAKCDYIGRGITHGYGSSTLSMFIRGDHGTAPGFPDIVRADVLRPWFAAWGRGTVVDA